jgi:hypothetical protein
MVKKITLSDMVDRFGKKRVLRALTKRRFRNKRRGEERRTGQKNFGFKTGGQTMAKKRRTAIYQGDQAERRSGRKRTSPDEADVRTQERGKPQSPSPRQERLSEWEKKQQLRKKAQDMGGNIIFADEWDKIDPGLKKGLGLHKGGGISGKSTVGELKKKHGSLKKGIRLKGKGSSFMEEYKKRVYGRAKGGSMVQGPMKRARGSGAAIKGTRFQGTF